ncbi:MAG: dipeptide ABC transporter ATP-binding protein [Pseudochelatococcus sp.]|jgi:peptide/nickel transport system ATP-binding protein|uniref:dipeptide ABC transporter ATP-binding protein n=1 Tax=Pseudochelatococcus sp. TaxID=2020869 RepID=UPI003D89EB35
MTLLSVENLGVRIAGRPILRNVSFSLARGETLGLVGESGSGKSMTALALVGLPPDGAQVSGAVKLAGENLLALDERVMCAVRGARIGMVFQEPMTALDPLMSIGDQVAEGLRAHRRLGRREARALAGEALARVGLDPGKVGPERFPHELSGGQRQRVVIAAAIALRPDVIVADEPTTALDVTVQAQILALLKDIVRDDGPGLLLISHDLAMIGTMADRIAVMHDGEIVETGRARGFFGRAAHPRTKALCAAAAYLRRPAAPAREDGPPLLAGKALTRRYPLARPHPFARRPYRLALDDVSLAVHAGESVALIGESGSGKSTLARLLLGLDRPDGGTVAYRGADIARADAATLRTMRRDVQAVFQDPFDSLDPRRRAGWIVAEPLHGWRAAGGLMDGDARERVAAALAEVGLSPDDAEKYPHAFSGGQRQRIALARALITRPRLIVLDEAVSALDVSIRAQILDLLADLRERHGLAYLFITHDLRVAESVAQRIAVMHDGRIVEEGAAAAVLRAPRHPHTRALLACAPDVSTLACA